MSVTPNPFQPPAETSALAIVAQIDWAAHADRQLSFAVTLSERDVKRYFPSPLPGSLFVLAVVLLVLLFALQAITQALLLFVVVFLVFLVWVRSRSNWKMALRQSPHLLEPISGYVAEQGIFTSSHGCQGYSRWEDLHSIKTTKDCVLLSGENWRLISKLIPWASFNDPTAARQAIESVIEQRKAWRPMVLGDKRMREPPTDAPLFDPVGPHVSFDGEVNFRDVAASAPGKKLRRAVRRWMLLTASMLIAAALSPAGGLMSALLIGFPMAIFSITMIAQLWRHPLIRGKRDLVAYRTRGWFCESGFFLQSVTGQSWRQWHSVDHQWHSDTTLCICLPGVSEGWFFFSHRQFASDADYRQACHWTAAGLGEASSASLPSNR